MEINDWEELIKRSIETTGIKEGIPMSTWASVLSTTTVTLIYTGKIDLKGIPLLFRIAYQAGKDGLSFDATEEDSVTDLDQVQMYNLVSSWVSKMNEIITEKMLRS